jgi:hypothetical protein
MTKAIKICSSINLILSIFFALSGLAIDNPVQYYYYFIAGLLFLSFMPIFSLAPLLIKIAKLALYSLSLLMGLSILVLISEILSKGEVVAGLINIAFCLFCVLYFVGYKGYISERLDEIVVHS